jgi:hypothetical protein
VRNDPEWRLKNRLQDVFSYHLPRRAVGGEPPGRQQHHPLKKECRQVEVVKYSDDSDSAILVQIQQ